MAKSKFGLGLDVPSNLEHMFVLGPEEHANIAWAKFERVGVNCKIKHGQLDRANLLGGVLGFGGVVVGKNSKHGHNYSGGYENKKSIEWVVMRIESLLNGWL